MSRADAPIEVGLRRTPRSTNVQAFRLPDGTVQWGIPLNRPCREQTCDHPLRVKVAVDRIVTWPSSWRVAS